MSNVNINARGTKHHHIPPLMLGLAFCHQGFALSLQGFMLGRQGSFWDCESFLITTCSYRQCQTLVLGTKCKQVCVPEEYRLNSEIKMRKSYRMFLCCCHTLVFGHCSYCFAENIKNSFNEQIITKSNKIKVKLLCKIRLRWLPVYNITILLVCSHYSRNLLYSVGKENLS